jgi:hypothetical protein
MSKSSRVSVLNRKERNRRSGLVFIRLPGPQIWLASLLLALGPGWGLSTHAQVLTASIQRSKWITQTGTNLVPLAFRLDASLAGSGLQAAELLAPGATNALTGSSFQAGFSTNFPAASISGTNLTSGSGQFNASYPAGAYRLSVATAVTNPITKKVTLSTNAYNLALTNDFAALDPVITNVVPFASLTATQTFQWRGFGAATNSGYAAFYLFEGKFDSNTVAAAASGGTAVLTNFTLLTSLPRAGASQTSVTATNINPALDHLALLEFHAVSENKSTIPVLQAESVTENLLLFLAATGAAGSNTSLTITPTTTNTVVVTWPTNGTSSSTLNTSSNLPARGKSPGKAALVLDPPAVWSRVGESVIINRRGYYEVVVPAVLPQRFFRLEPAD